MRKRVTRACLGCGWERVDGGNLQDFCRSCKRTAGVVVETEWMDDAACATVATDLFFPVEGQSAEPAKKVCAGCPVLRECAEYARTVKPEYGIWAGRSVRSLGSAA